MALAEEIPALNEALYTLDKEEMEFLSSQTGITDPDELKRHVMKVQDEIYTVSSLILIRKTCV